MKIGHISKTFESVTHLQSLFVESVLFFEDESRVERPRQARQSRPQRSEEGKGGGMEDFVIRRILEVGQ